MKSVLVTGAYGGMGRATAELLAGQGYRVLALDRGVEEPTDAIIPIKAEITDEESLKAALKVVCGYAKGL